MVDRRNHPGWDEDIDMLDIPGLKVTVMHRTCPSMGSKGRGKGRGKVEEGEEPAEAKESQEAERQ